MALGVIRAEGGFARGLLAAGILVSVCLAIFSAKWCFANAVSTRAAAIEIAELALSLGPDDPQTHYAVAVLYEKSFEPQLMARSLTEYETAAALSPNNYLAWLELGKARDRAGDNAGAEKAFQRALSLAPNYADIQWAYGNSLLRAGRTDDAFQLIRTAAAANPDYMRSAAINAMIMFDGNAARVRGLLGNTGAVNAALVTYALSGKRYSEAAAAWDLIAIDEKRTQYRDIGKTLSAELAGAKMFRPAIKVAGDIWENENSAPSVGAIYNGGFETDIKLKDAPLFDWQIGNGADPQIGRFDSQKHGGGFSLYMIFNIMQAADLRQVAQTVAVEPGRTYSFSGFFKAELKGNVAWEILDAGDNKSLGRTPAIASASDWTSFRADFSVPAGTDGIVVRLVRDGCASSLCPIAGKVWFDDLSLTVQDYRTGTR